MVIIERLRRQMSNPPRIEQVNKKIHGAYYAYADYNNNRILIKKGIPAENRNYLLAHELAHHKLRRMHVNKFSNQVVQELKKSPVYNQLKKQGYKTAKIPEEMFADAYAGYHTGHMNKTAFKRFEQKAPTAAARFKQLIRRRI